MEWLQSINGYWMTFTLRQCQDYILLSIYKKVLVMILSVLYFFFRNMTVSSDVTWHGGHHTCRLESHHQHGQLQLVSPPRGLSLYRGEQQSPQLRRPRPPGSLPSVRPPGLSSAPWHGLLLSTWWLSVDLQEAPGRQGGNGNGKYFS